MKLSQAMPWKESWIDGGDHDVLTIRRGLFQQVLGQSRLGGEIKVGLGRLTVRARRNNPRVWDFRLHGETTRVIGTVSC